MISEIEQMELTHKCLKAFHAEWKSLPDHLRNEYIMTMTTIGIGLMHSNLGEPFTEGFLNAAKDSLASPAQINLTDTVEH
jgi:hypothetical protein